jgi:hypothetical protein
VSLGNKTMFWRDPSLRLWLAPQDARSSACMGFNGHRWMNISLVGPENQSVPLAHLELSVLLWTDSENAHSRDTDREIKWEDFPGMQFLSASQTKLSHQKC